MRIEGRLTQWDDAKGYGFIAPEGGGAKLFVHAQAFGLRPRRPFVGERLSFVVNQDSRGKPRAVKVKSLEPRAHAASGSAARAGAAAPAVARGSLRRPSTASGAPGAGGLWVIPAFALLVLICHLAWPLPNALWGVYVAMSMATFIVYWGDKRAAASNGWRVAEGTLHGLALACGWPGALLAQQILAHKRAKQAFVRRFWLCVALNLLGFTLIFTPLGGEWLRRVA